MFMQHPKADTCWQCIAEARSPELSEIEALAEEMLRQGFRLGSGQYAREQAMLLAHAALWGVPAKR
jgi:hypothetical protein